MKPHIAIIGPDKLDAYELMAMYDLLDLLWKNGYLVEVEDRGVFAELLTDYADYNMGVLETVDINALPTSEAIGLISYKDQSWTSIIETEPGHEQLVTIDIANETEMLRFIARGQLYLGN